MLAGLVLLSVRLGEREPVSAVAVAVLFAGTGSPSAAETVAVLVSTVPGTSEAAGSTVRVTVTDPPGATVPTSHTAGEPAQVALDAALRVTPGGRVSVSVTAVAVDGPLSVTVTVYE